MPGRHGFFTPSLSMDGQTVEQIRTSLIRQLLFFDEQQLNVLDTYFPAYCTEPEERSSTAAWMEHYVAELEHIVSGLAGESPCLPDKVLIGSTVTLQQPAETKTYKICFPQDADPDSGRLSFLSPIGMRLLLASLHETVRLPAQCEGTETVIADIRFEGDV